MTDRPEPAPGSERIEPTVSRRAAFVAGAGAAAAGAAAGFGTQRYRTTHRSPVYRVSPAPPNGDFRTELVWRTAPRRKAIALTFDDGPDPRWTPRILDLLRRNDCKATFFVLQQSAQNHPGIVRRTHAEGHELGVHGVDHSDQTLVPGAELAGKFRSTADELERLTGVRPTLMRPPYGRLDAPVLWAAASLNLKPVLWSNRLGDDALKLARENLDTMTPGAIVLSHDGRGSPNESLIDGLRFFLPRCRAAGFELLTVSDLLNA